MFRVEMQDVLKVEYLKNTPMKPLYHSHPHYEIFYFHEGYGHYLIGDRLYLLQPGDVIAMHGMTLHCPNMPENAQYVRTVISFDPGYVTALSGSMLTVDLLEPFTRCRNMKWSLSGVKREQFEQRLAELGKWSASNHEEISQQRQRLAFCGILLDVYEWFVSQPINNEPLSQREQLVQRAISHLEQVFDQEVTLEEVATSLHINKHHLARKFKEVTGSTLFTYLYQRRINEAKMLCLVHPELSVTEIGYRSGFKNLSHFSRLFKEQVGMSPEKFRQHHQ